MTVSPPPNGPVEQPATPKPPRFRRRRFAILAVAVLVGGAILWQQLRPPVKPPATAEPPMPTEIADPVIRQTIEQARQAVIAKPTSG